MGKASKLFDKAALAVSFCGEVGLLGWLEAVGFELNILCSRHRSTPDGDLGPSPSGEAGDLDLVELVRRKSFLRPSLIARQRNGGVWPSTGTLWPFAFPLLKPHPFRGGYRDVSIVFANVCAIRSDRSAMVFNVFLSFGLAVKFVGGR